MEKHMKLLLGLLIALLILGITVSVFNFRRFADGMGGYNNGMMGDYNNGMMGDYNNGMMNGYNNGIIGSNEETQLQDYDVSKLIPLDVLTENVEKYISYYNEDLKIEDIFVFSNSEYYYSIIEDKTGNGAMELLVNPVTGGIYPEYGPNMMWNEKYGMHGSSGMMGGSFFNNNRNDELSSDVALKKANQYLSSIGNDLEAEAGGHEFDGYFTFHVEKGDEAIGMLSVNSYTGEVWYHNWHGNLLEIKSTNH